eukprot:Plantae.Rhodophyta-Purpureofilum_apyrenoidigerum.ctg5329.p1 GENE.Plantae.Rhodophyta-Purpureofilum_apyrenoidigerum.ctg5329~~Plantae.Rhodophyta-Purpureofilum_apyrenoidigerum.ctg5329.p1  ORF type:complete len:748 (+),score=123.53 Plantae.Rhodophyta-Purpureofilum_apyrenoidigerum.ctg5329:118-2361(+)
MVLHTLLAVLLGTVLLGVSASELTWTQQQDYNGTLSSDNVVVKYGINEETRTAYFGMELTDPEIVQEGKTWLGLGIGDPSSGSMLGADIVVVEFEGVDTDDDVSCMVTDRFVLHEAYPLLTAPLPYPVLDDCTESDWILSSCQRNSETGAVLFEVTRNMEPRDHQDRAITVGTNRLIWAYGDDFKYHGRTARGSSAVEMGSTRTSSPSPCPSEDCASARLDLLLDVNMPNEPTSYICGSLDPKLEAPRHIYRIEPALTAQTKKHVHHFVLHVCQESPYYQQHLPPRACIGGTPQIPNSGCHSIMFAWAMGMPSLELPQETGFYVDSNSKFILEVHLDNPDLEEKDLKQFGVTLYATETLRQYNAGVVSLGDVAVTRQGEILETGIAYQHACPSSCTELLQSEITAFASFQHMHDHGKTIYTHHYDEQANFLGNVHNVTNWDGGFQHLKVFEEPRVIKPGDILETTCIWDTSKEENVSIGFARVDEMCMDFLFYYPATIMKHEQPFSFCGLFRLEGNDMTVCGKAPQMKPNMAVPLTHGFNDTFGHKPSQCEDLVQEKGEVDGPTEEEAEEAACFAAQSMVELRSKKLVRMDELQIGDSVRTGENSFSLVYLFGHRRGGLHPFLRLETDRGAVLTVTAGHFLEVNGELVPAKNIRFGDVTSAGQIVNISTVVAEGLFNPHTLDGMIVVDGVRASTYTTAVAPKYAHVLLAPVRWIFRMTGINPLGSLLHEDRSHLLPSMFVTSRQVTI